MQAGFDTARDSASANRITPYGRTGYPVSVPIPFAFKLAVVREAGFGSSSRAQEVAVFTFAEQAERLFLGPRVDFSEMETVIRGLQPHGQTDLAAGLAAIREERGLKRYRSVSVLILSDGLSNRGDPLGAANALIDEYPSCEIDAILIDDTEVGRRIAESVVSIGGGWVRSAFSFVQLDQAVALAHVSSLRHELAGFATRRLELEAELSTITLSPVPTLLEVTSPVELTTVSLRAEILPTLDGLESLGRAVSKARARPYVGRITSV